MLLCDLVALDPCRLIIFIFDTFQMQDNSSINATWQLTKVWVTQYITVHPTNNVGGLWFDAFHCGWVPVITIVDVDSYNIFTHIIQGCFIGTKTTIWLP